MRSVHISPLPLRATTTITLSAKASKQMANNKSKLHAPNSRLYPILSIHYDLTLLLCIACNYCALCSFWYIRNPPGDQNLMKKRYVCYANEIFIQNRLLSALFQWVTRFSPSVCLIFFLILKPAVIFALNYFRLI